MRARFERLIVASLGETGSGVEPVCVTAPSCDIGMWVGGGGGAARGDCFRFWAALPLEAGVAARSPVLETHG